MVDMTAMNPVLCRRCAQPIATVNEVFLPVSGGAIHLACRDESERGGIRRPTPPRCAVCQIPIVAGEQVVYQPGGLSHTACHARAAAGSLVTAFLRGHAEEPFCQSCLSTLLGLRPDTTRKIVWALRVMAEFRVRSDTCARCAAPRVTIARAAGAA